jgi:hypothetical protein
MCAGLTTFNAQRNRGARPGDLFAVLGLGGPGHLAVQYAAKTGFRTAGIARGQDKEPLARRRGDPGKAHGQPPRLCGPARRVLTSRPTWFDIAREWVNDMAGAGGPRRPPKGGSS